MASPDGELPVDATKRGQPRLLCVGVACIDHVASLPAYPSPDDKVRAHSLTISGGGNVANTACAMAQLAPPYGPAVDIVTAAGDDANADAIVRGLRDAGVGVSSDTVQRYSGSSAFTYVISAPDSNGEHTRTCIHHPPSSGLTPEFATAVPLRGKYDAAHFDGRYPDAELVLARRCVEVGVPYSIDVEKPREGLDELLLGASVILCNASYCDTVLGAGAACDTEDDDVGGEMRPDDAEIAERLRRVMRTKAPRAVVAVTTLGKRGACLVRLQDGGGGRSDSSSDNDDDGKAEEEGTVVLPASIDDVDDDGDAPAVTRRHGAMWCPAWPDCQVVDTTGAGDAFQGGFLAALWAAAAAAAELQGDSSADKLEVPYDDDVVLARALRIGTRVAAKKVEKLGARKGLPIATEDDFLRREFEALLLSRVPT